MSQVTGTKRRKSQRHIQWANANTLRALSVSLVAVIAVLVPLWMVLVNSWKTNGQAFNRSLGLPTKWELLQNYGTVLTQGRVLVGLTHTLIVVIPSVCGILVLSAMAAWVVARALQRRYAVLYYIAIIGIIIPPGIVTTILVLRRLHLYGTFTGLICEYIAIFMPFGMLLMTGFIKTIPIELEEAARLEGAGRWRIFWRIIFPLLGPILSTAGFILTVMIWNDFYFAFFLLSNTSQNTLTLNLFSFVSTTLYEINWQFVFANIVISSLPLIAIYAFVHRRLVSGLTAGAVR